MQAAELLLGNSKHKSSHLKNPEIAGESVAQCSSNRKSAEETREIQVLQALSRPLKWPKTSHNPICSATSSLPEAERLSTVGMATNIAGPISSYDDSHVGEIHELESPAMPSRAKSSPLSTAPSSPEVPSGIQQSPTLSECWPSSPASNPKFRHQPSFASTLTITAPRALETRVIEIDGRIQNPPADNSWRNFRVKRREQDIGSLWEIREEYWVKEQAE